MPRIELTGGFYEDSALQFDAQRCVNMFTEIGAKNSAKSRGKLKNSFGQEFIDSIQIPNNPEIVFYLGEQKIYSGGTYVFIYSEKSSIGYINVCLASEIGIFYGYSVATGTTFTNNNGFYSAYNGKVIFFGMPAPDSGFLLDPSAAVAPVKITDPDFTYAISAVYKDSYFIWLTFDDISLESRMYISDNFATDPANFVNALDYTTLEADPDEAWIITELNNEVVVFGANSIEFYYNSGNVDFPFEANQGVRNNIGCSDSRALSKIDGIIFFIRSESDSGSYKGVYMMDNYNPVRISTPPIEEKLSTSELQLYTYIYEKNGNYFYTIHLLDDDATVFQYNMTTGIWNELSYGNSQSDYISSPDSVFFSRNLNLSVSVTGIEFVDLYKMTFDSGYYYDRIAPILGESAFNKIPLHRQRTLPHLTSENKNIRYKSFELDLQKGVGNVDDPNPEIKLYISRDGGMTYGNAITMSMGANGNYKLRAIAQMLGIGRDLVFKIESDSPVQQEWFTAYIDYEVLNA